MSHTVVNAVVIRQWGSASRKAVALALAHHADGDSWSTLLGQQRIAAETELSVRQVGRILREFEGQGLVSREKRGLSGQQGGRNSDRTILVESAISEMPLTKTGARDLARMNQKDTMSDNSREFKRTNEHVQKDTDDSSKGQAMSEEPSESHQLEPSVIAAAPLNELKEVLVEVFGEPPPQNWSLYNRIATWIRDQGGTPELIRFKASRIAEEWGIKALTVTSLEKHWTRYDAEVGQLGQDDIEKYQAEMRRLQRQRRAEELEAGARGLTG